jgi:hypothetical protein
LQDGFAYSDDYTSSNNQDLEDEEDIQIDYADRYNKKIDEDMRLFHNKNIAIRESMQEIYAKCENEIIDLTDWKKNAIVKLKNYKVVIKELMSQISLLQEEIDKLKSEQEKFLNEYDSEQQQWIEDKNIWEGERKQMNKQITKLEREKQSEIISYEGQLEDLMREIEMKKEEKDNMTKKWEMEQSLLKQVDIEVSVRE